MNKEQEKELFALVEWLETFPSFPFHLSQWSTPNADGAFGLNLICDHNQSKLEGISETLGTLEVAK